MSGVSWCTEGNYGVINRYCTKGENPALPANHVRLIVMDFDTHGASPSVRSGQVCPVDR